MAKLAWVVLPALCAVAVAMTIAPPPVEAADPAPATEAAPAPEPVRPPGFACGDKALSGTGPGFDSSRDHSEETAKEAWLEKARTIYTDATWQTAKELNVTCVKQGLYSKCFASAVPCGVQKSSEAAEAPAKSN